MPRLQAKSFATPDDIRTMPLMRVETIGLGEARIGLCRFDPGWRWSTNVGPLMGAASCPIRHVGYTISGTIHVEMDDGQAMDIGPNSGFEIPPGHDKWVVGDELWVTVEWGASARAMEAAVGEAGNRSLATVMFTDIVASTETLQRVGDSSWRDLLAAHNERLRVELSVFRGREVKTTGDGFLAVFDSATRAASCAIAMIGAARSMGLSIRIGINTGEIEVVGEDVRGIAVHTAARLLALAGSDEVIVSSTTRDLLDGTDIEIEDAGVHELKGISGARQVFRLRAK